MIFSPRFVSSMAILLVAVYASESQATVASASGTIAEIRTNSSTLGVENGMFVTGVSSLAACPTTPTDAGVNLVMLRIKGDSEGRVQHRTALAAQLAGKTVIVFADDTVLDSGGFCYLRSIHTIN